MRTTALALACAAFFTAALGCMSADPARRQRLAVGLGGGSLTSPEDDDAWVGTGLSWHASYAYTLTRPNSIVQVAAECALVGQGPARLPFGSGAEIDLQTSIMLMPGIRVASPSRFPVVFAGSVGPSIVRTSVRLTSPAAGFASESATSVVPGFTLGFGGGFAPRVTWWFGGRFAFGAKFRAPGGYTQPFDTGAGAFEVAVLF